LKLQISTIFSPHVPAYINIQVFYCNLLVPFQSVVILSQPRNWFFRLFRCSRNYLLFIFFKFVKA
jgi:hypothetical protein